jgi:hydrogenase nickel incorporation protein HypA/HybF
MHELSIVLSIIDIASKEAEKVNAQEVTEIELDIGELCSVEQDAFDFAWQQAVKNSVLHKANRIVNTIDGEGVCLDCGTCFPVHQLYDACPVCGDHFIEIKKGKELRVKSLVVL